MDVNVIHNTDCLTGLRELPADVIDCSVTSPPYFGLRDYGCAGQIGLEATPEEYVARLLEIFREVRRVLKPEGTLWLNLGDSYANDGKWGGHTGGKHAKVLHCSPIGRNKKYTGLKPKDLIGIPWRVAFALQADGWYLRSDIIWSKPNPMPESVTDRPTKSHEYIFLLAKSERYYYNAEAISEPVAESTKKRLSQDLEHQAGSNRQPGKTNGPMKAVPPRYGGKKYTENPDIFNRTKSGTIYHYQPRRNKRDVWTVSTQPFSGVHFAVFPEKLIEPCILAGCPEGGVVLDPFIGSGTTAVVAYRLGRNYIGYELNPDYCRMAEKRVSDTAKRLQMPLFERSKAQ